MRSDRSLVRSRWRRIGDYLQITSILYDPVLMSEPYIRTTMTWIEDPTLVVAPYPCEEATEVAVPTRGGAAFPSRAESAAWSDPKLTDRFGTPYEARLGGSETMYPEYIAKMKTLPRREGLRRGDLGRGGGGGN